MRLGNTTRAYGLVSQLLHWFMVPLVWGVFILGLTMTSLDYYHPWYHSAPWWHKSFGLLTLLMLGMRLIWILVQRRPLPVHGHKPWEVTAAWSAHALMYVLLGLICASGYLIATLKGQGIDFFGWLEMPALVDSIEDPEDLTGSIHLWVAISLTALSLLHATAALKHHFVDKDATLKRMIG